MFSPRIILFALTSVFLDASLVAAFASGTDQQDAGHFAPDAAAVYQNASQIAPPAGADVLVLEDDETFVFDAEGKVAQSRYLLYKVLTQKGAQEWDVLSYSWEPWRQERPILKARVITPDNTVHPLDPATITDAPARESNDSIFSDRRVMRAPLPAIAPGSLVEEEQTSKESAPFYGAGMVERFYFGQSAPVQHSRLILDAPSTLPLRYNLELLPDFKPKRTEADGRVRLTFDDGPIDPLEAVDPELPSDIPAYPNIVFSTAASWQQVATDYETIVDKQISAADLKTLVTRLTEGKASRDDKAAAILQYLDREVRHTGVEFAEAAVVPHSPSETLTRKYGDCKDKAALLVAMLRTANIPAYVALLNAGNREDVAPDLPGMGMFDHAIVFVPGSPDLWIDATDEYARLGQLPVPDQGRLALIVRPGSNALVPTPVTASAENIVIEKREIHLAENGPARIIETTHPHGSVESSYRRSYADKQNKSRKEDLTSYVKSQYLAEKLDRMDRSDPADLSKPFELILETNRARRGITELDVAAVGIRFDTLFSRLPADLQQREKEEDPKADTDSGKKPKKKRTADYQLGDAFITEWQYTIFPPVGFKPRPLPQDSRIALGPAVLTENFSTGTDNVVHATIRFDTVKPRLTVAEATDLRNNITQVLAGAPILIYFDPLGQSFLHQGKVREALQSYHDLIALHPTEAVHHLQIAEVLSAAGMGEAARDEARLAVKLEPNSALAQKTLAYILEYDSVGRKFRPGSDYAGAEAAFRAAEKLDPDDKGTVADLAILLEYDHWGARYSSSARLKDSIAEYRKLTPEKLSEMGLQNNLAFTLFYTGEFAEAGKMAEQLNPQPTALIVACEAALHGSQAGLSQARKLTASDDQFREIADAAGGMLSNIAKYSLAADLLEAGASGADATGTAAEAATLRKTQPHAQLTFSDDPTGVAMRFLLVTSNPTLSLDQLTPVCSRNAKTVFCTAKMADFYAKRQRRTVSGKARAGEFPDIGLDMSLARAQPRVQGDDASGYKVVLWPSASYKASVYVVKEEGHYRILGATFYPFNVAGVGLEVLDRLSSNNLAGARQLLDWVRDDFHLPSGDDPLAGSPFASLWTKGHDADAGVMKPAAASLLVGWAETASQGLVPLESAQDSSRSKDEHVNVALAMLEGYETLEDYKKALAVAIDLAGQCPESRHIFLARGFILRSLARFAEAEQLAQDRLKRLPDDLDAMRSLIFTATSRGDHSRAHAMDQKLIDQGRAEPEDLNHIAWQALFGKVEASDVDDALKAAELSNKSPGILHTLGCVYAEIGKTKEAGQVLIQSMDSLDLDEPDKDYWYAFGLIAEQDGELHAAIADYGRVTKPEEVGDLPDSTYTLAQMRLKAMQAVEKQSPVSLNH